MGPYFLEVCRFNPRLVEPSFKPPTKWHYDFAYFVEGSSTSAVLTEARAYIGKLHKVIIRLALDSREDEGWVEVIKRLDIRRDCEGNDHPHLVIPAPFNVPDNHAIKKLVNALTKAGHDAMAFHHRDRHIISIIGKR